MLKISSGSVKRNRELFRIDNLNLNSGEVIGLIGANGAGKSSFFDDLVGGGKGNLEGFFWFDKNVQEMETADRSKTISLVESKFSGVNYMSVFEYVSLGRAPWTTASGRLTEQDRQLVHQMMDRMCVGHLADQDTTTLSDGERQRASVARALVQQTPIVLLDEPTAFLDYLNKEQLMQTLNQLAKEANKLILLSNHDLELVLKYAQTLLVIEKSTKQLVCLRTNEINLDTLIEMSFLS